MWRVSCLLEVSNVVCKNFLKASSRWPFQYVLFFLLINAKPIRKSYSTYPSDDSLTKAPHMFPANTFHVHNQLHQSTKKSTSTTCTVTKPFCSGWRYQIGPAAAAAAVLSSWEPISWSSDELLSVVCVTRDPSIHPLMKIHYHHEICRASGAFRLCLQIVFYNSMRAHSWVSFAVGAVCGLIITKYLITRDEEHLLWRYCSTINNSLQACSPAHKL